MTSVLPVGNGSWRPPLEGRVGIVTGGARGIGASIAEELVRRGCRVVLVDVLGDELDTMVHRLGPDQAVAVRADIIDERDWESTVALAEQRFGAVHLLVNNAAIVRAARLESIDLEQLRTMFDVNVFGAFLGIRAVVPAMRAATGGSIVNIGSIAGLVGISDLAAYSATKWAIRGLTRSAAVELGSAGIRVNSVLPGGIETPMLRDNPIPGRPQSPLGRLGAPADIAAAVCYLASDEARYCTGAELVVDGGRTAGFLAGTAPNG